MRPVYVVSGGVSKFTKARPNKTFPSLVKEAYDYALADLSLTHPQFLEVVDGSVASYFSDHFTRQLMAGIIVQDYLGLCPKPSYRVEGAARPVVSASRRRGKPSPQVIWIFVWPSALKL